MAYQVLARKWRPQDFETVVGQEAIVTALRNGLAEDRIAAAYLFSGIRGVGKTSVARILAKALNCERGMANGPCNECPTCQEVGSGSNLDILEVDAATYSKVEQVRELTENLKYKPVRGRYKVVVLDEVHRLSRQAFDALLKIIEEPPPHLVFIFATTELESVPATILSRCQEFNFQRVPRRELTAYLRQIADAEKITIGDKALLLIARASEGSVRDAVALLDQLATFGSGTIGDDDAGRILGGVDAALHHRLLEAIFANDRTTVVAVVADVEGRGWDPRHVYGEFLAYCRDALHLSLGAEIEDVELPDEEAKAARKLATSAGYENLLRLTHQLLASEEGVRRSESSVLAVEIAWLRGAELPKLRSIEALIGGAPPRAGSEPVPAGSTGDDDGQQATAAGSGSDAPEATPPEAQLSETPPPEAPPPEAPPAKAQPAEAKPAEAKPADAAAEPLRAAANGDEPAAPPTPEPAANEGTGNEGGDDEGGGDEGGDNGGATGGMDGFLALIRRRRQVIAAHLEEVESIAFTDGCLTLVTGPGDQWLEHALRRDANRQAFDDCLHEAFGADATWALSEGTGTAGSSEDAVATPEEGSDSSAPAVEPPSAATALEHPTVQAALDVFGGTAETIEETTS